VQGLAEDESVDGAVGQFVCLVALELFGIEEALRVPADLRRDVMASSSRPLAET
jgi:hypothetical protein